MSPNPLRNLPSVTELLESPRLSTLVDRISHNVVVSTVRTVLDELRSEVQNAASEMTLPSVSELAERIARRVVESEKPTLRPVINATGILVHPELGAAPLAEEALAEMAAVARDYANVELDLATGRRARRVLAVEARLKELTGAEAALVVNNNAAGIMLALAALAAGREVVVSRGQLIEIDDGFRLPDVMEASGAVLREVGTTNKTHVKDYEQAIGPQTAAVMLVRPGNFAVVGFSQSVPLEELVEVAHRHQLPVVHNVGSAALVDLDPIGLADQPVASTSIQAGADLVLFSGDGLLGGPQCGIIVGRKPLVEKIDAHPMARAVQVGKATLAALGATLRLYRDPQKAARQVPLLHLLGTSVENLENRAQRLASQLVAADAVAEAEPVVGTAYLGGESIPGQEIPTRCIAVKPQGMSVERLAAALRSGTPPVVARVQQDRLLVDLRTVIPRQDQELVEAFTAVGATKS